MISVGFKGSCNLGSMIYLELDPKLKIYRRFMISYGPDDHATKGRDLRHEWIS